MTVFRINTFEVEQGKAAAFLESQRATAARQGETGGFVSRRVLRRASGETPAAIYSVVFEFDDWGAAGRFLDAMAAQQAERNEGPGLSPSQGWRLVQSNFATEVSL